MSAMGEFSQFCKTTDIATNICKFCKFAYLLADYYSRAKGLFKNGSNVIVLSQ